MNEIFQMLNKDVVLTASYFHIQVVYFIKKVIYDKPLQTKRKIYH